MDLSVAPSSGVVWGMDILVLVGVVIFVVCISILGMIMGVFMRGKPIAHCGSASFDYKGDKVDCQVCGKGACEDEK